MHIAIDARPLEGGHSSRGTGVYTRSLIDALKTYVTENTYSLFTKVEDIPEGADVIHYPFFDPFFLTLPLRKPAPTVVTVHDLIPLAHPSHFRPGLRGAFKWRAQKWSLSQAAHVITDSEASKRDIARLAGLPAKRIAVVPLAPDSKFFRSPAKHVLSEVKKRYNLPDKFLLYVGDVNWNKNVPGMLRALALVPGLTLVLVGKAFTRVEIPEMKEVASVIRELHLTTCVVMTGYVDDEALVALYTLAAASIMPSFAEGFGFPVLEAMACGTPTVVATGSSLDEIAGPSIQVDPQSPEDMANGIKKAMKSEKSAWQKKASVWVAQFTWEKVARATSHVYETVAA